MNFVDAEVEVDDAGEKATLVFDEFRVELPAAKAKKVIKGGYEGKKVVMGIRPEDISNEEDKLAVWPNVNSIVTNNELLGAESMVYFTVAGANMSARVAASTNAKYNDPITLCFNPDKVHVFDKETELTITN
jgi:multiple sugar transport system ATP-binding protein